jgi:hypothetical protein
MLARRIMVVLVHAAASLSCMTLSEYPPEAYTRKHLTVLEHYLELAMLDHGCLPGTFSELKKLSASRATGVENWKDGWKREYAVVRDADATMVVSAGHDGKHGTEDDLFSRALEGPLCSPGS